MSFDIIYSFRAFVNSFFKKGRFYSDSDFLFSRIFQRRECLYECIYKKTGVHIVHAVFALLGYCVLCQRRGKEDRFTYLCNYIGVPLCPRGIRTLLEWKKIRSISICSFPYNDGSFLSFIIPLF
jgi:hypothetical protein